ncbi:four helix bundle protein [Fulvivirga sp. RKSG066]|uniref:four helix bundle protein n=1 Tax=Fulvivirga aurantia TaxID=2529383 RepID=UPI0012BB7464|nr:four helix bundle protein [Fulvivirga aurantia]MTI20224.1 four helix bundle protein [Fulvivirga aurantia]
MRNYKNLKIWQKGFKLAMDTYALSAELPSDERFGLVSQINRAAVSIPSNIAEGSARSTDKAYKQYLEIALGSSFELETQLLIIKSLSLVDEERIDTLIGQVVEEEKMLSSFLGKLTANSL